PFSPVSNWHNFKIPQRPGGPSPAPPVHGVGREKPGSGRACYKISSNIMVVKDSRGGIGANRVGSHSVTAFRDHNVVSRLGTDARAWVDWASRGGPRRPTGLDRRQ